MMSRTDMVTTANMPLIKEDLLLKVTGHLVDKPIHRQSTCGQIMGLH